MLSARRGIGTAALAALLAWAFGVALIFWPGPADAQRSDCPVVNEALKQAEQIRKLRVLRSVPCVRKSKTEVEAYLRQAIQKRVPKGKLEAEGEVYRLLGLIGLDVRYVELLIRLYTGELGGFYEPEENYFAMAAWIPAEMQRTIAVHELTHALQDQHFSLEKLMDQERFTSDELLARSALIEGDASAVMFDYVRKQERLQPLAELASVDSMVLESVAGSTASMAEKGAPRALQSLIVFPYASGLHFVHSLLRTGGYSAVDAAFKRFPRSTEEVLHPELYARETPDFVVVPVPRAPAGVRLDISSPMFTDTIGEFTISALLSNWLSSETARSAADGWGGDRIALYRRSASRVLLVWDTHWDSAEEAQEFFRALASAYRKRFAVNPIQAGPKLTFVTTTVGRVELAYDGTSVQLVVAP
ncbi:MAG: hypothetical protein KDD44_01145 [Bdellovibrionales bacterium]|nr:hypothetical protein [Bdellovibrionales bacterium]